MLYRETVAVYCENLTKVYLNLLCGKKCSFFNVKPAVTYRMAVSQEVSCYILRQTPSFILSLVSYNYVHFHPFLRPS